VAFGFSLIAWLLLLRLRVSAAAREGSSMGLCAATRFAALFDAVRFEFDLPCFVLVAVT